MRLLALIICLGIPAEVIAQGGSSLTMHQPAFGVSFTNARLSGAGTAPRNDIDATEWFSIGIRGAIVSPRLLDYRLTLAPEFRQLRRADRDGSAAGRAVSLQLDGEVNLFRRGPFNMNLGLLNLRRDYLDPLGSETESDTKQLRVQARLGIPGLPTRISYHRSATSEIRSTNPESLYRRTYRLSNLNFQAANARTRIDGFLRQTRQNDAVQDHLQGQVSGTHRTRWGRGSQITSQIQYWRTENGAVADQVRWSEAVALYHGSQVRSTGSAALARTVVDGRPERTWSGDWTTSYGFATSFAGATGLRGFWRNASVSNARDLRMYQRLDLRTRLSPRTGFELSGSAGYEIRNRHVAEDGWIDVAEEEHLVTGVRRFTLANANVDPASIRLRRSGDGLVMEDGLDYRAAVTGLYTEIFTIPTGRIAPGDTLLATYRYSNQSEGRGGISQFSYHAAFRHGVFRVYHSRALSIPTSSSGSGFDFLDRDDIRVGASAQALHGTVSLSLQAEYSRLVTGDLVSTTGNLTATSGFPLPARGQASAALTGSVSKATLGRQRQVMASFSSGWTFRRTWIRATAAAWLVDELDYSTFQGSWALDGGWKYGKLEVNARIGTTYWETSGRGSQRQLRFSMYVAREI